MASRWKWRRRKNPLVPTLQQGLERASADLKWIVKATVQKELQTLKDRTVIQAALIQQLRKQIRSLRTPTRRKN